MSCNVPVPRGETCPACGQVHRDYSGLKRTLIFGGLALFIIGAIVIAGKSGFLDNLGAFIDERMPSGYDDSDSAWGSNNSSYNDPWNSE